jgi:hypothetical protein
MAAIAAAAATAAAIAPALKDPDASSDASSPAVLGSSSANTVLDDSPVRLAINKVKNLPRLFFNLAMFNHPFLYVFKYYALISKYC